MYWLFFVFSASHTNQGCNIAGFIRKDNVAMFPFSYQNSEIRKQKAESGVPYKVSGLWAIVRVRDGRTECAPTHSFQISSESRLQHCRLYKKRQCCNVPLSVFRKQLSELSDQKAESWERRSLQGIRVVGDCTCKRQAHGMRPYT